MLLWPFNKYPGTDYETFNWEWILKTVKEYTNKVDDFIADITETWNAFRAWTTGEINQMHDDFANYVNVTEGALNTGAIADGAITERKINTQFFKKIENCYATPEMYGAVGDGVTDDTDAIIAAVNSDYKIIYCKNDYKVAGNTAWRPTISIPSNKMVYFEGKIIFEPAATGASLFNMFEVENTSIYNIDAILETENAYTNAAVHGLTMRRVKNCNLYNSHFTGFTGDGLFITDNTADDSAGTEYNNFYIDNIHIDGQGRGRNGITIQCCNDSVIENVYVKNINGSDPKAGIDIETENNTGIIDNLKIGSVYCKDCRKAVAIRDNVSTYFNISIDEITAINAIAASVAGVYGDSATNNININTVNEIAYANTNDNAITIEAENINIDIQRVNIRDCTLGNHVYISARAGLFVSVNYIIIINSTASHLYVIADYTTNPIPKSETAKHFTLFGIDNIDNFVQRKGLVKWINSFICDYLAADGSYSTSAAPILRLSSAFQYVNPLHWGNSVTTFFIDTGGTINTGNNVAAQALDTQGSQVTVWFKGNEDLTAVERIYTGVFKAQQ